MRLGLSFVDHSRCEGSIEGFGSWGQVQGEAMRQRALTSVAVREAATDLVLRGYASANFEAAALAARHMMRQFAGFKQLKPDVRWRRRRERAGTEAGGGGTV